MLRGRIVLFRHVVFHGYDVDSQVAVPEDRHHLECVRHEPFHALRVVERHPLGVGSEEKDMDGVVKYVGRVGEGGFHRDHACGDLSVTSCCKNGIYHHQAQVLEQFLARLLSRKRCRLGCDLNEEHRSLLICRLEEI